MTIIGYIVSDGKNQHGPIHNSEREAIEHRKTLPRIMSYGPLVKASAGYEVKPLYDLVEVE